MYYICEGLAGYTDHLVLDWHVYSTAGSVGTSPEASIHNLVPFSYFLSSLTKFSYFICLMVKDIILLD